MAVVMCPRCGAKNRVDENRARQAQPVCGRCGAALSVGEGETEFGNDGHPVELTDDTFAAASSEGGGSAVARGLLGGVVWAMRDLARRQRLGKRFRGQGRWVIAKLDVDSNPQTAAPLPTSAAFRRCLSSKAASS